MAEVKNGKGSPYYQAVSKHRKDLVCRMESRIIKIAEELKQKELINNVRFMEIRFSTMDSSSKANLLMDDILSNIERDFRQYSVLINILDSFVLGDFNLRDISEQIKATLSTLRPNLSVGPPNSSLPRGTTEHAASASEEKLQSHEDNDSAFFESSSASTRQDSLCQDQGTSSGSTVGAGASNFSAGRFKSSQEVTDSAALGKTIVGNTGSRDIDHGECRKKLIMEVVQIDIVKAQLNGEIKLRAEDSKVIEHQKRELSQREEELEKKNNIVESLKDKEKMRIEEIKKLRNKKEELEDALRSVREQHQSEREQSEKKIADLEEQIKFLKNEIAIKNEQLMHCQYAQEEEVVKKMEASNLS